jgi:Domain of unknown function (DUF4111)
MCAGGSALQRQRRVGDTHCVLPVPARETVDDLLVRLDRAVPGQIEGLYVVGSACMGAFRAGRSDLDFVVIVAGELDPADLACLRRMHLGHWGSSLVRDVALRWRWPLVCNGIYLKREDLCRSPLAVTPIATHVAGRFRVAEYGGDVNPVTWHTLAHHGIVVRGPEPDRLQVRTDDAELRTWTLDNLNGYWRRWAERMRRHGLTATRALPRRLAASGVLGAPRLHYTITTGAIVSKEDAALYALEVFEPRWHALIGDALAYWRGSPAPRPFRRHPMRRDRDAAEFVAAVIKAANAL